MASEGGKGRAPEAGRGHRDSVASEGGTGRAIRDLAHKLLNKHECEILKAALKHFRATKSVPYLCTSLTQVVNTKQKTLLLTEIRKMLPDDFRADFEKFCTGLLEKYQNDDREFLLSETDNESIPRRDSGNFDSRTGRSVTPLSALTCRTEDMQDYGEKRTDMKYEEEFDTEIHRGDHDSSSTDLGEVYGRSRRKKTAEDDKLSGDVTPVKLVEKVYPVNVSEKMDREKYDPVKVVPAVNGRHSDRNGDVNADKTVEEEKENWDSPTRPKSRNDVRNGVIVTSNDVIDREDDVPTKESPRQGKKSNKARKTKPSRRAMGCATPDSRSSSRLEEAPRGSVSCESLNNHNYDSYFTNDDMVESGVLPRSQSTHQSWGNYPSAEYSTMPRSQSALNHTQATQTKLLRGASLPPNLQLPQDLRKKKTPSRCSSSVTINTQGRLVEIRKVKLNRTAGASLGFSIRGGKDVNSGVYVSDVVTGSQAQTQGLLVGDRILKINDVSFRTVTHEEAVQVIKRYVKLVLYVTSSCQSVTNLSQPVKEGPHGRLVVVQAEADGWLGCSIKGGTDYNMQPMISNVDADSPADVAGLKTGDLITRMNGVDITSLTHAQIVSLATSSRTLKLHIKPFELPERQDEARDFVYPSGRSSHETTPTPTSHSHFNYCQSPGALVRTPSSERRLSPSSQTPLNNSAVNEVVASPTKPTSGRKSTTTKPDETPPVEEKKERRKKKKSDAEQKKKSKRRNKSEDSSAERKSKSEQKEISQSFPESVETKGRIELEFPEKLRKSSNHQVVPEKDKPVADPQRRRSRIADTKFTKKVSGDSQVLDELNKRNDDTDTSDREMPDIEVMTAFVVEPPEPRQAEFVDVQLPPMVSGEKDEASPVNEPDEVRVTVGTAESNIPDENDVGHGSRQASPEEHKTQTIPCKRDSPIVIQEAPVQERVSPELFAPDHSGTKERQTPSDNTESGVPVHSVEEEKPTPANEQEHEPLNRPEEAESLRADAEETQPRLASSVAETPRAQEECVPPPVCKTSPTHKDAEKVTPRTSPAKTDPRTTKEHSGKSAGHGERSSKRKKSDKRSSKHLSPDRKKDRTKRLADQASGQSTEETGDEQKSVARRDRLAQKRAQSSPSAAVVVDSGSSVISDERLERRLSNEEIEAKVQNTLEVRKTSRSRRSGKLGATVSPSRVKSKPELDDWDATTRSEAESTQTGVDSISDVADTTSHSLHVRSEPILASSKPLRQNSEPNRVGMQEYEPGRKRRGSVSSQTTMSTTASTQTDDLPYNRGQQEWYPGQDPLILRERGPLRSMYGTPLDVYEVVQVQDDERRLMLHDHRSYLTRAESDLLLSCRQTRTTDRTRAQSTANLPDLYYDGQFRHQYYDRPIYLIRQRPPPQDYYPYMYPDRDWDRYRYVKDPVYESDYWPDDRYPPVDMDESRYRRPPRYPDYPEYPQQPYRVPYPRYRGAPDPYVDMEEPTRPDPDFSPIRKSTRDNDGERMRYMSKSVDQGLNQSSSFRARPSRSQPPLHKGNSLDDSDPCYSSQSDRPAYSDRSPGRRPPHPDRERYPDRPVQHQDLNRIRSQSHRQSPSIPDTDIHSSRDPLPGYNSSYKYTTADLDRGPVPRETQYTQREPAEQVPLTKESLDPSLDPRDTRHPRSREAESNRIDERARLPDERPSSAQKLRSETRYRPPMQQQSHSLPRGMALYDFDRFHGSTDRLNEPYSYLAEHSETTFFPHYSSYSLRGSRADLPSSVRASHTDLSAGLDGSKMDLRGSKSNISSSLRGSMVNVASREDEPFPSDLERTPVQHYPEILTTANGNPMMTRPVRDPFTGEPRLPRDIFTRDTQSRAPLHGFVGDVRPPRESYHHQPPSPRQSSFFESLSAREAFDHDPQSCLSQEPYTESEPLSEPLLSRRSPPSPRQTLESRLNTQSPRGMSRSPQEAPTSEPNRHSPREAFIDESRSPGETLDADHCVAEDGARVDFDRDAVGSREDITIPLLEDNSMDVPLDGAGNNSESDDDWDAEASC